MTKTEIPLCEYCGKPLTWNNSMDYVYYYMYNDVDAVDKHYCSRKCLTKDNNLKYADLKDTPTIVIRDKAKEK